jgi:hypothetical protein
MQVHLDITLMGILVQVIDSIGIERGSSALDSMDLVTVPQEKLGQIASVLARNARK